MFRVFVKFLFLLGFRAVVSQNFEDLKFIFVHGPDPSNNRNFSMNETSQLLRDPKYDNDRPTMLYGYGYTEKYTSESTQTIVSSYIERNDHNILVVEWSKYSDGNYYFEAIPNSYKVGAVVGKTLLTMRQEGFNLDKFHLVGHSLGGHFVGFIGRSVYENSNKTMKIKRITSLDPAGPFFYGIGSMFQKPITQDDGEYVDVIHTDHTFFGAPTATGTADFWPNGGKDQPRCPPANWDVYNEKNFCSHRRSWAYYTESVRQPGVKTFFSVACQSWEVFTNNKCQAQGDYIEALMGIDSDPRLKGNYFLQTNAAKPYSQGEDGTFFEELDEA